MLWLALEPRRCRSGSLGLAAVALGAQAVRRLTYGRLVVTLGLLLLALLGSALLALIIGSTDIDWGRGLAELWQGRVETVDGDILINLRLPRVIMAAVVGAALAVVGAVFQGMLRNPLADPFILGVSGGASLGVTVAVAAGVGSTLLGLSALPLSAFLGAMASVGLIYAVASVLPGGVRGRHATNTLLLTGVVFNVYAVAVILFIRTVISPLDSQHLLFWLMGSLSAGRLTPLERRVVMGCVGIGVAVLILQARRLNLLALGDDTARSLGIRPGRTRMVLFAASSLVVGAAVSASGMVGFVGLVIPHLLRLVLGSDHRLLVPASVLGGAVFLVLADLLARASFPLIGQGIPVGAVTAFIGVPLFFVFLIRNLRLETGAR